MNFLHICAVFLLASILTESDSAPNHGAGHGHAGEAKDLTDKGITLEDSTIMNCAKEAKMLVDAAYLKTRETLKTRMKKGTISYQDMMAFNKQPVGKTRNIIRSADYMDVTVQLVNEALKAKHQDSVNASDALTEKQKVILSRLTGCAYQHLPQVCDTSPYRTITGECNNRKNPILGASNTGYRRLLSAEYEDGVSLPRGWTQSRPINGFTLPLTRKVSNEIVKFSTESLVLDEGRSLVFMQYGQWLDHDVTLSPDIPSKSTFFKGVDCETSCVQAHPCFPIKIPLNDSRYVNGAECIPMFRSAPACGLVTPVREQINVLTAFVDGSQVYGSELKVATALRNNTNQLGLLAVNQNFMDNSLPFLPFGEDPNDLCVQTNQILGLPCFLAGDTRVSEQPGLTVLHTVFMREHNRIATELHEMNPKWNGEKLYEGARKIIGSMIQKIAYKDWLPLLLGSDKEKLVPEYKSYNEDEDPAVSNAFTNAFRMGHTLIQPFVYRLAEGYVPYEPEPAVPLHQMFFAPWRILTQGGIDPLMRGMMANKAKLNAQNQMVVDELRDRLFIQINHIGLDLAAINMQRGREHGLPGYNAWRRFCNLSAPQNVDELAIVMNNRKLAEKLMELYGTPENIDLWVGGVSEPLVPGGRTGELLSCIIGDQFRRSRDGDRFFYENPSVFSPAQRRSIESVTLAHIICANTNIKQVPQNVFLSNSYPEDFLDCTDMPTMDLLPWKVQETDADTEKSSTPEE
ncbi:myeloperoxidase-like [Hyla sarda]|uniref:myeloperoxidase-like n=1 Tax=Hyla sarda TaxID=327740 RepID=UPI0024C22E25|nr:myeloperoxidase-like [Hyla sarda]XP_056416738.1 myeloperoxidase-like [Hyla sarda]XP_056416739.1 myeloperoxidase-like [Hyla sarda]